MPETSPFSSDGRRLPEGRGRLKIFLGYAPGVGKTYAMLEEAVRRKSRGQDVVIATMESEGRQRTAELVQKFERVGSANELDLNAVLARKPDVVIIDRLGHRNPPGYPNAERWQDVDQILAAGINVLSTINIHDFESLVDSVYDITGEKPTSTVPDHVFHAAAEVEMVDLTPRALVNRLDRGDIVPQERIEDAKSHLYRLGNLSALRELALREIAGRVDEDLAEYRRIKRIEKPWATNDRVMICIGASRSSLRLLRRGWRIAQRLHGEVVAVTVEDHKLDAGEEKVLRDDLILAERLNIPVVTLHGQVAAELIKYARDHNVTQLVIGHSERKKLQDLTKGSILTQLARELRTIDFLVVAAEKTQD